MKRVWYFSLIVSAMFFAACSEDDEKPSLLTLEERIVKATSASFNIRINEGIGEGTVYFDIAEASDESPTTTGSLKSDPSTRTVTLAGGGFTFGSFLGLTPGTSYVIYAFMEVDGVESQLATLQITTPSE